MGVPTNQARPSCQVSKKSEKLEKVTKLYLDILHGHVFAMKFSLEHFSLAALTQLRDQFWFEITFHSQKPESKTDFTICQHSCFDCQHLASRRSQNTRTRSREIFPTCQDILPW